MTTKIFTAGIDALLSGKYQLPFSLIIDGKEHFFI